MQQGLTRLEQQVASIRIGRAYPEMLDALQVTLEGKKVPLPRIARVAVVDAMTLSVEVGEQKLLGPVMKAIRESPFELTPVREDERTLTVPVPRPTRRTKEALIKVVHAEGEAAKNKIREGRRLGNDDCKRTLPSRSAQKTGEVAVQKLHDSFIERVVAVMKSKEKEIEAYV